MVEVRGPLIIICTLYLTKDLRGESLKTRVIHPLNDPVSFLLYTLRYTSVDFCASL